MRIIQTFPYPAPLLPGYLRGYWSQACLSAVTKEEIYYVESKRISTVENL
jgi:hypothetical protein